MTLLHFAYLDAGTGSVLIQAIIGLVLGGAVVMRTKLRGLFTKVTGRKRLDVSEDDEE